MGILDDALNSQDAKRSQRLSKEAQKSKIDSNKIKEGTYRGIDLVDGTAKIQLDGQINTTSGYRLITNAPLGDGDRVSIRPNGVGMPRADAKNVAPKIAEEEKPDFLLFGRAIEISYQANATRLDTISGNIISFSVARTFISAASDIYDSVFFSLVGSDRYNFTDKSYLLQKITSSSSFILNFNEFYTVTGNNTRVYDGAQWVDQISLSTTGFLTFEIVFLFARASIYTYTPAFGSYESKTDKTTKAQSVKKWKQLGARKYNTNIFHNNNLISNQIITVDWKNVSYDGLSGTGYGFSSAVPLPINGLNIGSVYWNSNLIL